MDRAKIVDFYLDKIDNERFEIDQVRKDLKRNGFEEDEGRIIVRLVDSELQRRLTRQKSDHRKMELSGFGVILTIIGLIIMFLTRFDIIETGQQKFWDYAALLSGLTILLTNEVRTRTNKFKNN